MGDAETRRDVVILGGGLAGLTAAIQLTRSSPGLRITVLEKNSHPVPEAAFKVGESTIEFGSHYLQRVIGLEQHLRDHQLPKMGLRFFLARQNGAMEINARPELGVRKMARAPTWQLDRGRLENHLAEEAHRCGIELSGGSRVTRVELGEEEHLVRAMTEAKELVVSATWVIDASGRAAILRRQLGLSEDCPHDVNAVWLRTRNRVKIDNWGASHSWRARVPGGERWLSTNHLCGRGYWVWLIPLASGGTSIGVVADPREVPFERIRRLEVLLDWLRENEPEVGEAIESDRDAVQDFRVLKGYAHGCTRVFSPQRWCLTGIAGVFLDPLYSPGTDFIGVANTLITRMVGGWRKGEAVDDLVEIYDALYRSLFQLGLATYADQYPLLGNPEVSGAKITWDILSYFSVVAPLLLSERFADLEFMAGMADTWQRFFALSQNMQEYFQGWYNRAPDPCGIGLPGVAEEEFDALQRNLAQPSKDPDWVRDYLAANVAKLETVADAFIRRSAPRLGVELNGALDPCFFKLDAQAVAVDGQQAPIGSGTPRVRWASEEDPTAAETGLWSAWLPERIAGRVA